MKRDFLGDSFDLVKRHWSIVLGAHARLFFDPKFVPPEVAAQYTAATAIPPLPANPPIPYSILNDPDTGLLLSATELFATRRHLSLGYLAEQLGRHGLCCSITFDQSFDRRSNALQQRRAKIEALRAKSIEAFYYRSHACFLFAFPDPQAAGLVRRLIIDSGIPDRRIEPPFQEPDSDRPQSES